MQNGSHSNNNSFDYLIKLLIVGDSGVGKTNLLLRFTENEFSLHTISTIGVDFKKKVINVQDKKLKLQIWDTAGQERFQTMALSYYKGAWGIILTYSIIDIKSFQSIEKWLKQIKDNSSTDVIIVLVGNKSDLESQRLISKEMGKELALKFNIPFFFETSAKDNNMINAVFQYIGEEVLNKIRMEEDEGFKDKRGESYFLKNGQGKREEERECFC